MAAFVSRWKQGLPSEPVAITVVRGAIPHYTSMVDHLTCDAYPFFVPGGPGFPDGPIRAWISCCESVVNGSPRGWMIAQGFEKTKVWARPTPAQMQWQVHTALALGVRGCFAFCHRYEPGEGREPIQGLLTREGEPSPLYRALGRAYQRAATWLDVLSGSRVHMATVRLSTGATPSSLARLHTAADGRLYVAVVRGFESGGRMQITLPAEATAERATSLSIDEQVPLRSGRITLTLEAGQGDVLRLE
jgi:hypothetical protein